MLFYTANNVCFAIEIEYTVYEYVSQTYFVTRRVGFRQQELVESLFAEYLSDL